MRRAVVIVAVVALTACADAAEPATERSLSQPSATGTATPSGSPKVQFVDVASVPEPVGLAFRPDDPTLFVVSQGGTIVPIREGVVGEPVLDIDALTNGGGESGLLGLAFHATDPLAYVDYTDLDGNTVVAEYRVGTDGVFDVSSRRELLTIDQPYGNHNGGQVVIGPDGLLYIFTGDGGSGGDPERRALDTEALLGKVLRVDPTPSATAPYTIPTDNPFVGDDGARPEIWSIGLRNPWRASFDRVTGDLWIADVGQGEWEEINVAWADEGSGRGANFGWSAFEGTHRYNDDQPPDGVTMPIHEYQHGTRECSVSGGALYRGAAVPAMVGWYVYADYCSGQVRGIKIVDRAVAATTLFGNLPSVTAVQEGPDGELYVLSLSGRVVRIEP